MAIILNTLKEPFDNVASPIKFGVKIMFYFEIYPVAFSCKLKTKLPRAK